MPELPDHGIMEPVSKDLIEEGFASVDIICTTIDDSSNVRELSLDFEEDKLHDTAPVSVLPAGDTDIGVDGFNNQHANETDAICI